MVRKDGRTMKAVYLYDVNEDTWRKFRSICVLEGRKTGDLLTEILEKFIESREKGGKRDAIQP